MRLAPTKLCVTSISPEKGSTVDIAIFLYLLALFSPFFPPGNSPWSGGSSQGKYEPVSYLRKNF